MWSSSPGGPPSGTGGGQPRGDAAVKDKEPALLHEWAKQDVEWAKTPVILGIILTEH